MPVGEKCCGVINIQITERDKRRTSRVEKLMAVKCILLIGLIMTLIANDTQKDKTMKTTQVTIYDGYWFVFEDGDNEIAANGSIWSGKEWIYFNDQLVSEKRNMTSFTTIHEFESGNDKYRLEYIAKNIFTGKMECTVFKNEQMIGQETVAQFFDKRGLNMKKVYACLAVGLAIGITATWFGYGLGYSLGRWLWG